jgi:hypothetical protein
MVRTLGFVAAIAVSALLESAARADIYKVVNPDGTVTYTDNLAALPAERQEYYAKKRAEAEQKRQELENAIGKEELQRREAEQKRAETLRQVKAEEERKKRAAEFDAIIEDYKRRAKARDDAKAKWQGLMRMAKERLKNALLQYNKAKETWEALATKADYTLLPGQAEQRDLAKQRMVVLEKDVDVAITEVQENLPERARKEGIPPGWLRD